MKNPDLGISRLCQALKRSRLVLRYARDERRKSLEQYVGSHWSEEGAKKPVPVNLLSLYVGIMAAELIGQNPRVSLSSHQRANKPMIAAMEDWCNAEIVRLHLGKTLKRVVTDALFSIGILKVALASPAESGLNAWNTKAGQPFAEAVSLDDFVFDINARDFREVSYIGHRVRVPLEIVQDSKLYSKARKELTASDDNPFNLEGDERAAVMQRGFYAGNEADYEDMVDLWEIYLPRHRVILTLADAQMMGADTLDGKALREQGWIGPDSGPYHILGYGDVPDNAMPKAPVQDLIDFHEFVNVLWRKLMEQAKRQKTLLAVQGGQDADAQRVQRASDGDVVRNDNPDAMKEVKYGGPSQDNFLLVDAAKQVFAYLAKNLDMIGGLSPQSKTLGQDRLLAENASHAVTDLQNQTIDFTAHALRALCWYWHHDPFRVMHTQFALPGMPELTVGRQVGPGDRQKQKFEDLNIQADPYSLKYKTPEEKMAQLQSVVTQIVMPMAQQLEAQGISIDLSALLQKIAKFNNMPDLPDIITVAEPPEQVSSVGGDGPTKPAQTERRYVRENMPGRTEQGDSLNLRNSLLGVNPGGARNGKQTVGA